MENLLDKFIRNGKKAKLWALFSLFAFFTAATTVVVVAYNIKNAQAGQAGGTTTVITDTVFISKEDTATAALLNEQSETIRLLRDSCKYLQDNYQLQLQEVDKYMGLWKECQSKPPCGEPPPAQPVSVMIYKFNVPDFTIGKIIDLIRQSGASKSGYTFNTATAPAINPRAVIPSTTSGGKLMRRAATQPAQKYYAGIKYFDVKFANEAAAIANTLNNNSSFFDHWKQLYPVKADVSAVKADIEVWLNSVTVKTVIY